VASEQEGKSIGDIFRESFQKGMDQAREKRERNRVGEVLAADRGLAQTERGSGRSSRPSPPAMRSLMIAMSLLPRSRSGKRSMDDWREGKS